MCDLGIALAALGRVELAPGQCLLQDKQVLLAPGASECQCHVEPILLAAVIAQGRQGMRVALARDHGTAGPRPRIGARIRVMAYGTEPSSSLSPWERVGVRGFAFRKRPW